MERSRNVTVNRVMAHREIIRWRHRLVPDKLLLCLPEAQRLWIVTGKEQAPLVQAQLSTLPGLSEGPAHVLTEPVGRNMVIVLACCEATMTRERSNM